MIRKSSFIVACLLLGLGPQILPAHSSGGASTGQAPELGKFRLLADATSKTSKEKCQIGDAQDQCIRVRAGDNNKSDARVGGGSRGGSVDQGGGGGWLGEDFGGGKGGDADHGHNDQNGGGW